MMTEQKILIVDDEKELRELLIKYLIKEGLDAVAVADSVEMDKYLNNHRVDLIILDLMLPGENGLSIARRLQQNNQAIIILSARGNEIDRIIGLEVGVDDYIAKPFNPRELLARIRSVLRRYSQNSMIDKNNDQHIFRFGEFILNTNKQELTKSNKTVAITTGEFNMLVIFIKNINRVLSREKLLEISKGYDREPFDRSIDICVGRLRKKIEDDPSNPVYLKTIWGSGYLFSLKN